MSESKHRMGSICSDFLGGDWAECSCGWRSETVRNPTEAKLAYEQHMASLPASLPPMDPTVTEKEID